MNSFGTSASGGPNENAVASARFYDPGISPVQRVHVPVKPFVERNSLGSLSVHDVAADLHADIAHCTVKWLRGRRQGGSPQQLVQQVRQQWKGDASQVPPVVRTYERYPAVFNVRYEVHAALLGPNAVLTSALLEQYSVQGRKRLLGPLAGLIDTHTRAVPIPHELPSQQRLSALKALGSSSPTQFVRDCVAMCTEGAPSPGQALMHPTVVRLTHAAHKYQPRLDYSSDELLSLWGYLLTILLRHAVTCDLPMAHAFLQLYSLQHNLPLPPPDSAWFLWSTHPSFSYSEALWSSSSSHALEGARKTPVEPRQQEPVVVGVQLRDHSLKIGREGKLKMKPIFESLLHQFIDPRAVPVDPALPPPDDMQARSMGKQVKDLHDTAACIRNAQSGTSTDDGLSEQPAVPRSPSTGGYRTWPGPPSLPSYRIACPQAAACRDALCAQAHPITRLRPAICHSPPSQTAVDGVPASAAQGTPLTGQRDVGKEGDVCQDVPHAVVLPRTPGASPPDVRCNNASVTALLAATRQTERDRWSLALAKVYRQALL